MKKPDIDAELLVMNEILQVLKPLSPTDRTYVLAAAILQMKLVSVDYAYSVIAAVGRSE